ncbi:MAG TPA: hypothetical protein VHG11_02005 [Pseudorhizobium sp.]|nr:hypothetical protein [Pseudorhizobium sp.]
MLVAAAYSGREARDRFRAAPKARLERVNGLGRGRLPHSAAQ